MSIASAAEAPHAPTELAQLPVGQIGMWWFLASEVMVFGGLMGAYVLARVANGGWAAERAHVNATLAVINTVVLVTSSLAVVQAHAAAVARDRERVRRFLLITLLLGCTFLGIKAFEYSGEIHHGFTPSSSLFWSFYYTMTGLHGLHVIGGLVAIAALAIMTGRPSWSKVEQRVEYVGLYWHFVDVVWIFLFPLLYLA